MQISTFSFKGPSYPKLLLETPYPPTELHVLGDLPKSLTVAVVGSRRATEYGRGVTYRLSYDLAKAGLTVVSGLALGIDATAHQGALDAGGQTVAVLAHGLDRVYPVSNQKLADAVVASGGGLISEYEPGIQPQKHHFPARNRIIAGLSKAVIITEADAESGALITANFALDYNRQVMAVPGNITSLRSAGPNNLLKSGAAPVTDAAEVIALLGFSSKELQPKPVSAKSPEEAKILELLKQGCNSSQALIEQSGLTASQFANLISLMEITGKVSNLGAGVWVSK